MSNHLIFHFVIRNPALFVVVVVGVMIMMSEIKQRNIPGEC